MASASIPIIMRIYPTFTEIRQQVDAQTPHQLYIPQSIYNQILAGSLNLEGVNVLAMNAVLKENNQEGKEIYINKDKEIRKVKMIRSKDSLVKDLETNRYYHVERSHIEFPEIPEEMGTEITFTLDKPGTGTLSYLMSGFSWKPRYSVNLEGDKHLFESWADINNNTEQKYTVSQTELFGGDIHVVQHRQAQFMSFARVECMAMGAARAAPQIQGQSEIAGLYMYPISSSYNLEPRSTFSLPFISPKLEIKRVAVMQKYFHASNDKGQSSRVYRIKSSEFLPAGSVTIREDGRVIGQAELQDLSADEDFDLTVGNDPETSYERSVKTIEHNENTSQYEITVKIKTKKERKIDYEYVENVSGRYEVKAEDQSIKIENNSIKKNGQLEPKSSQEFKYTVKFYYK